MPAPLDVRHNPDRRRFEADVDGGLARCDYEQRGDVLMLYHAEVPRQAEGRGIAGQVVQAALDHARAHGLKVMPACSYVRSYMRRHPESLALLPDGASA